MHVSEIAITNYMSFRSTPAIELSPKFNIIVGRNNSGKTALVKALSSRFGHKAHRSQLTVPTVGAVHPTNSTVKMAITLSRDELVSVVRDSLKGNFSIPTLQGADKNVAIERFQESMAGDDITIDVCFEGDNVTAADIRNGHVESQKGNHGLAFRLASGGDSFEFIGENPSANRMDRWGPTRLVGTLRERFYVFQAERLNIHRSPLSSNTTLQPNARNLPEVVLHLWTHNEQRARRLDQLVTRILPDILHVTSHAVDGQNAEIMVWTVDPKTEREDLANLLLEHGTGLSQIIAILYVVLTAEQPHVIIIDEPQSFLHPGAVRELIDILQYEFPQHQYIVSTHSPTVISAVDGGTTLLVKKNAGESSITALDLNETENLRHILADVGSHLSDVFGIDRILWVEGLTEEKCFPLILRKHYPDRLKGTAIRGVRATGELQNKDAVRVAEIYTRLSTTGDLLPTTMGFVFDTETYSEKVQAELKRRLGGKAHFIPRRMFENYLLDAEAIAETANNIGGFSEEPITSAVINEYLEDDDDWIKDVHGANLLAKIFSVLSQNRVVYDKIRHGRKLTQWLVEHKPDSLRELADFLATVIDTANPAVPTDDQIASRGS